MAFVRSTTNPQVGDIRTLKTDVGAGHGTITRGSRVKIIGQSYRGWDIEDLESGERVYETISFDLFER